MTLLFKPHAEWWLEQVSALIKKQIRWCKFQLSRKLRISSDPFSVLWCFYLLGLNENYEVFVLYSKSSIQGKFYHNCCEIFQFPLPMFLIKKLTGVDWAQEEQCEMSQQNWVNIDLLPEVMYLWAHVERKHFRARWRYWHFYGAVGLEESGKVEWREYSKKFKFIDYCVSDFSYHRF